MTDEIKTSPKPEPAKWLSVCANVSLMLLVGCCLCASLAASLL